MNIDDELKQLRADSVDVSSLNRVRNAVLDKVRAIGQERSRLQRVSIWLWTGFPWRYAILGCAAVFTLSLGLWRIRSSNVPYAAAPQIVAAAPVSIPVAAPTAQHHPVVKVAHSRRRRPLRPKLPVAVAETIRPKEETDTVVQIMTDDPNIVIYWLLDTSGGH